MLTILSLLGALAPFITGVDLAGCGGTLDNVHSCLKLKSLRMMEDRLIYDGEDARIKNSGGMDIVPQDIGIEQSLKESLIETLQQQESQEQESKQESSAVQPILSLILKASLRRSNMTYAVQVETRLPTSSSSTSGSKHVQHQLPDAISQLFNKPLEYRSCLHKRKKPSKKKSDENMVFVIVFSKYIIFLKVAYAAIALVAGKAIVFSIIALLFTLAFGVTTSNGGTMSNHTAQLVYTTAPEVSVNASLDGGGWNHNNSMGVSSGLQGQATLQQPYKQ